MSGSNNESSGLTQTIRRHADGQTVTATVAGDWDGASDGALIEYLHGLLDDGVRNIVVDAEQLTFCDSTCLGALVGLHQATMERGGWLRVVAPPPAVRRPMILTGLDRVLHLEEPGR